MKQELKPCPFCGQQPSVVSGTGTKPPFICCNNLTCITVSAEGPREFVFFSWNTRAPDARVQLLAKALLDVRTRFRLLMGSQSCGSTPIELIIEAALAEAGINQEKAI